ncbi:MAG: hypothetical protein J5520_01180 [Bacteroidales bacterium]|nr:hypothetical protein [Bacteroidales bacterium]
MRKFSAHGIGKALSILMAVLVFSSFAAKSLHCFQHDNLISTVSSIDGENVDTISADCYLCDFSFCQVVPTSIPAILFYTGLLLTITPQVIVPVSNKKETRASLRAPPVL